MVQERLLIGVKRFGVVALMLISGILEAQNRSNIWQLGNNPFGENLLMYGLNFNNGSADTFTLIRPMGFFITNASICDTNGEVLFYTNGIYIANRNHDTLLNSNDFNPGYATNFYTPGGMGLTQAAIIIPRPNDSSNYYVFSVSAETLTYHGSYGSFPIYLSCSEIDMTLDNGLGGITSSFKNIHIVEDTLYKGRIIACKHANGRDWWIVVKEMWTNRYYKLLVTPVGISAPIEQFIGTVNHAGNIYGMAVFSPDGSKYANVNLDDTINFLKFDRCTGDFYEPISLAVPDSPATLSATLGCQFSPNSRFLYVNSYRRLWQFDTWASDIQGSRILIDTINPLTTYPLFLEQLGPDGKIYLSTFDSNGLIPYLHVINHPDSLGVACDVEFDSFDLPPVSTNVGIPNLPNYDLGALEGSPCDTIINIPTAIAEIKKSSFRITPNPVSNWLNIVYQSHDDALFELYDFNGHRVAAVSLYHYFKNRFLNVSSLPVGVYLAVVTKNGKMVRSEKVVVEH